MLKILKDARKLGLCNQKTKEEEEINPSVIVLSSKISLLNTNAKKQENVETFIKNYVLTVNQYISTLHNPELKNAPSRLKKEDMPFIQDTYGFSARVLTLAVQQALSIINASLQSLHNKERILQKLLDKDISKYNEKELLNYSRDITKLKEIIINKKKTPILDKPVCVLDSNIIDIIEDPTNNKYKLWVSIHSTTYLGKGKKSPEIFLPSNRTKHLSKLEEEGYVRQGGVILTPKYIQLSYAKLADYKEGKNSVGIDVGENSLFKISDGREENKQLRTYTYKDICNKVTNKGNSRYKIKDNLEKKKKNNRVHHKEPKKDKFYLESYGFKEKEPDLFETKAAKRLSNLKNNYIGEQLNDMDFSNIDILRREDLYNFLFWDSSYIIDHLDIICHKQNVSIVKVDSRYTSQRCSNCGWTHEINRNSEKFKCVLCGFESNADYNASLNIALEDLPSVKHRKELSSKDGFLWNPSTSLI